MTAEIAILNKSAIALAADSAITISGGGQDKIYNSVNKIFELSAVVPMGVMIYGNLEYMGIPLETIIKQYRSKKRGDTETVLGYAKSFFEYLEKDVSITSTAREANLLRILYSHYSALNQDIITRAGKIIAKHNKIPMPALNKEIDDAIEHYITLADSFPVADCFKDATDVKERDLFNASKSAHDTAAEHALRGFNLTKKALKRLERLGALLLHRSILSDNRSGLVISGFGDDEMFPSLQSVEIDGTIQGKLKLVDKESADIGRDTIGAEIFPFAQHEMVDRFLNGVDPEYDDYINRALKQQLKNFGKGLIDSYFRGTVSKKTQAIKNLDSTIDFVLEDMQQRGEKFKNSHFNRKVKEMVHFMPNQELANMAESLINLTSLKRRVSAEKETVGGPVDVAVISKAEGFVWIRRKHYFSKEFNPRYFARLQDQFGQHDQTSAERQLS